MNNPPLTRIEELVKAGFSKNNIKKYWGRFYLILSVLDSHEQITFDTLRKKFSDVSEDTVKGHLKEFLSEYTEYVVNVRGFYPKPETIIKIAEIKNGPVISTNLMQMNFECKDVVDNITMPLHKDFIDTLIKDKTVNNKVVIDKKELISLMYDEYRDFTRETDNGLSSIAGRLNEELIMKALENAGMDRGKDYVSTGKNSEGDIWVYQNAKAKIRKTLYIEVKSYHARERFLRGLHDINQEEKIGIGFFRDPSEFNPERTKSLLTAKPIAIYLPCDTYKKLHDDSKRMTTTRQEKVYRPFSLFVEDMKNYNKHGALKPFS